MNISNIKPEHSDAHCHVQRCSWQRSAQKAQLDDHIQFPNSNMTTTELRKSNSNPVRDKESSNLASKLLSDAFKLITEGTSRACHLKRNFREGILLISFGMSEIVFIHKEIGLQRICEWKPIGSWWKKTPRYSWHPLSHLPAQEQRSIHAFLPSGMSSSQTQLTTWKWRRCKACRNFSFSTQYTAYKQR